MLEIILDKHILWVCMGILTVIGIGSKCIVNVTLKRLVRAAGNMNKSTHPLMRLVRAKFEHACMVSDTVENVGAFVDKYLYEYRVAGMKLHSVRRMENAAAGLCVLLGGVGALLEYYVHGMSDMVLKTGAMGAGLAIFIYLVHLTTDENYRMEAVRNYMVDYLENVCLHRYEKAYQKEIKVMSPEAPAGAGVPAVEFGVVPEEEPDAMESQAVNAEFAGGGALHVKAANMKDAEGRDADTKAARERAKDRVEAGAKAANVKAANVESADLKAAAAEAAVKEEKTATDKAARQEPKEEPKEVPKDVLIRQILEEFMA